MFELYDFTFSHYSEKPLSGAQPDTCADPNDANSAIQWEKLSSAFCWRSTGSTTRLSVHRFWRGTAFPEPT